MYLLPSGVLLDWGLRVPKFIAATLKGSQQRSHFNCWSLYTVTPMLVLQILIQSSVSGENNLWEDYKSADL